MEEGKTSDDLEVDENVGEWLKKLIPEADADLGNLAMDTGILDEEELEEDESCMNRTKETGNAGTSITESSSTASCTKQNRKKSGHPSGDKRAVFTGPECRK